MSELVSTSESSSAIRCTGLTKRYGSVVAVDGLDLDVPSGECFGLLGPNGAGKTTTVEILEGLLAPDAGSVEVLGLRWAQASSELRQRLGIQLQETKLPPKLTVEETVRLFSSFYPRGPATDEVLEVVGLTEKRKSWVRDLSGGQRQRLAVACALVGVAELLFLDEPTTGLDPQARLQVWDVIRKYQKGGGTVLLTTHYMEEAAQLCDRVAIMDHGRILALGAPADLVASLGADHVVEFSVNGSPPLAPEDWQKIPGVRAVRVEEGTVSLTVKEVHRAVPALLEKLSRAGAELGALVVHHATLEDVFLVLTGRHLRDE